MKVCIKGQIHKGYEAEMICLHLVPSYATCCASPHVSFISFNSDVIVLPHVVFEHSSVSRWNPSESYLWDMTPVHS